MLAERAFPTNQQIQPAATPAPIQSLLGASSPASADASQEVPEKQAAEPIPETTNDQTLREKLAAIVGAGNMDYQAFSEVVNAWVDQDPLGAIDFLSQGKAKDEMLRWIVSVWSERHPEAASRWLSENQDRENADHAIEGLAQGIAKEDPGSALQWAQAIQEPSIKTRVITSAGYQQFRHDHSLAEEALSNSGLPPAALEAIRETWQSSWQSSTKRNSQNMSSVAAAARAAGVDFSNAQTADEIIAILREGTTPESGPFKGKFFGIPNLTPLEGQALLEFLKLEGNILAYRPGEE